MDILVSFLLAITATVIGALPFGLVNLTVLDVSFRRGNKSSMQMANGAAWVEVVFGLIALSVGAALFNFTETNKAVYYFLLAAPAVAGIALILKKKNTLTSGKTFKNGFLKGALLNLISFQVLLYWLFAATYINTFFKTDFTFITVFVFALGIWAGKMGVLWLYAVFSKPILKRSAWLAKNINIVTGLILIGASLFQILK